jgi:hypothetical protein
VLGRECYLKGHLLLYDNYRIVRLHISLGKCGVIRRSLGLSIEEREKISFCREDLCAKCGQTPGLHQGIQMGKNIFFLEKRLCYLQFCALSEGLSSSF